MDSRITAVAQSLRKIWHTHDYRTPAWRTKFTCVWISYVPTLKWAPGRSDIQHVCGAWSSDLWQCSSWMSSVKTDKCISTYIENVEHSFLDVSQFCLFCHWCSQQTSRHTQAPEMAINIPMTHTHTAQSTEYKHYSTQQQKTEQAHAYRKNASTVCKYHTHTKPDAFALCVNAWM